MTESRDPRIFFAAERTLLAWNRTSLALIAFGFVVERAGLLLRFLSPDIQSASPMALIFWVGIGFIALGSVTAFYSSKQYLGVLKSLTPIQLPSGYNVRWGVGVQLLIAFFGLALIVALALGHMQ